MWRLGTDRVLCERPHNDRTQTPADEENIHGFLEETSPNLPVPHIFSSWIDSAGTYFVERENIDGKNLKEVWKTKNRRGKQALADELSQMLAELRGLQARYIGRVDHTSLVDQHLFNNPQYLRMGPFSSGQEFWSAMASTLQHIPSIPPLALEQLGREMPRCEPFTYTHGFLSKENFFVKDDRVVGIVGWGNSGFFPVWWEYVKLHWLCVGRNPAPSPDPDFDEEWFTMLEPKMAMYPEAVSWYGKFRSLWYLGLTTITAEQHETASITLEQLLSNI